jgi:O-glycosyl hydrolase
MDYYPMLWNFSFNATDVENYLQQNPGIKYILVLNEPNLNDQSNKSPQAAASEWPKYEAIADHTGVKIVGPAITWGTQSGYEDPVKWLDAFYTAYRAANNNRDPHIDYLAFHWYDYGLADQLDRLKKYGKEFWVTEFANWHPQNDGAQIDTLAKQITQMTEMVSICESRSDVYRYAWFTGRWDNDVHFTSLLAANGQLTDLGKKYISLPEK